MEAGRCRRGQACSFAHSEAELRPQPDLFGTRLCAQFGTAGGCPYGKRCRFAHGEAELRPVPVPAPRGQERGRSSCNASGVAPHDNIDSGRAVRNMPDVHDVQDISAGSEPGYGDVCFRPAWTRRSFTETVSSLSPVSEMNPFVRATTDSAQLGASQQSNVGQRCPSPALPAGAWVPPYIPPELWGLDSLRHAGGKPSDAEAAWTNAKSASFTSGRSLSAACVQLGLVTLLWLGCCQSQALWAGLPALQHRLDTEAMRDFSGVWVEKNLPLRLPCTMACRRFEDHSHRKRTSRGSETQGKSERFRQ